MWLFGPLKVKITPPDFVTTQIDILFSKEFVSNARQQFVALAERNPIFRNIQEEDFVRERQRIFFYLLTLAWAQSVPLSVFVENPLIWEKDNRGAELSTGVYSRCLTKAQGAGVTTFAYITDLFLSQVLTAASAHTGPDYESLRVSFGTEFQNFYALYRKGMKRYRFVSSREESNYTLRR